MTKTNPLHLLLVSSLFIFSNSAAAYKFYVGGRDGWVQSPKENYNQWAERMRFLINDTLYFKYPKGSDSVLQVSKEDYDSCNIKNPLMKMDGGDSLFTFDRPGLFYFISGVYDHCQKGQKLIVAVLHIRRPPTPPSANPPTVSPGPATPVAPGSGGISHPPGSSPSSSPVAPGSGGVGHPPSLSPGNSPSSSPVAPGPRSSGPAPSTSPISKPPSLAPGPSNYPPGALPPSPTPSTPGGLSPSPSSEGPGGVSPSPSSEGPGGAPGGVAPAPSTEGPGGGVPGSGNTPPGQTPPPAGTPSGTPADVTSPPSPGKSVATVVGSPGFVKAMVCVVLGSFLVVF